MSPSWRVTLLLSLTTGVAYLVRADVAVAQEQLVPALGISIVTMGAITAWGFQLPYAIFQVPGGMFGERFGARVGLTAALLGCGASSLATAALPAGEAAIGLLVGTRVVLGLAQAAVFPIAAMAVMAYVPSGERVRATSIYIATSSLGSAAAPLLMAPVMERFGWRAVFLLSGAIAMTMALLWAAFMVPGTSNHRLGSTPLSRGARAEARQVLDNAPLLRLSVAYLLHSATWFVFVFWFFRYLTEGRGFTVLASGMWGSLPGLTSMIAAPIIGAAADRLGRRVGPAAARRRVAIACLLASAACVGVGATVPGALLAVLALSLSACGLNGAEAPFFMTATALGATTPGFAAGFLNLFGNLGGVLSIWLVPRMSEAWGWNGTLAFWSAACLVAALLWLTIPTADTLPGPTPA